MKTVVIPGKLSLDINKELKLFNYFSLGEIVSKDLFKANKEAIQARVVFCDNPEDFAKETLQDFSSFYKVGNSSILVTRKYSGVTCKLLATGIGTNSPTVYVNNNYYRLIRFKVDNLYPPALHLMDIIMLQIINSGDIVLHGASLTRTSKSESFLIIAPPDTGKTYTTYKLLEKGYKFLGEDLSYYSKKDDSLKCMPYTSTWGHHFSGNRKLLERVPMVQLFVDSNKDGVDDLFGKDSVIRSRPLGRIYIIEKGPKQTSRKIKVTDKLVNQLVSIQRNEFSYFKNPMVRAFEYFNNTKVDKIYDKEAQTLKQLLLKKEVWRITGADHTEFYQQIDQIEQS